MSKVNHSAFSFIIGVVFYHWFINLFSFTIFNEKTREENFKDKKMLLNRLFK